MLKVYIDEVNQICDYDSYHVGYAGRYEPRNSRIEVRGHVAGGFEHYSGLVTGRTVLVPLGCAEAPTNTRWLKALAATCTPSEVAKITAAYEALPRESDQ